MTPRAIDRVVRKCLRKEPDERWQTAADLKDVLQWLAEEGFEAKPGSTKGARFPRVLAPSIAVASFVGILVWILGRDVSILRRFPGRTPLRDGRARIPSADHQVPRRHELVRGAEAPGAGELKRSIRFDVGRTCSRMLNSFGATDKAPVAFTHGLSYLGMTEGS